MKEIDPASPFSTHIQRLNTLLSTALTTPTSSNWQLAIEKLKNILLLCEICTCYEDDLLNALLDSLKTFTDFLLCQQNTKLLEEVKNSFKKLLLLLAKKVLKEKQEFYIPQVIILLEKFASAMHEKQGQMSHILPFYILAHEYIGYIKDTLLETKIVASIAAHYSYRGNVRLGMFYSAYQYYLEFGQANSDAKSILPLIKQEYYFLYHFLVESSFIFRQIAINQNVDKTVCFNLYDNLCELANIFLGWEDYPKAEQCFDNLRTLLANYSATNEKHITYCIEGMARVESRQKPVNNYKELQAIEQYKEKKHCLKNYREKNQKLLPNTDKLQEELSYFLVEFVRKLCDKVIEQLGPSPCKRFSLLRLGSMARKEACFYSDLEFAIVWIDKKECASQEDVETYFRAFVAFLELKIIALGETNELCGIPKQQEGLALIAQRMKRGLRFDEAGHYPFSGKCCLIGEVKTLASMIDISNLFKDKGLKSLVEYSQQLPFIAGDDTTLFALLDADILYGDIELAQEFNQACYAVLNQINEEKQVSYRQVIGYSLITDSFLKESELSLASKRIDIKTQLLHLPQRAVATWSLFYGIKEKNSQERIVQLVVGHIIPQSLAYVLSYVIEFGFSLRLQAQWFYQQEQDDLYLEEKEGCFSLVTSHDRDFFNHLIEEIYPFLRKVFKGWQSKVNEVPSRNTKEIFQQYELEARKIILIIAEHSLYSNNYLKANQFYQYVLQQRQVKHLIELAYQKDYLRIRQGVTEDKEEAKEDKEGINDKYLFFKQAYQPVVRASVYLLLMQNKIPVNQESTQFLNNVIDKIRSLEDTHLVTKTFIISSIIWVDERLQAIKTRQLSQEEETTLLLLNEFITDAFFTQPYSSNLIIDNLMDKLIHSTVKAETLSKFIDLIKKLNVVKLDYDIYYLIYQLILQADKVDFNNKEMAYQFYKTCQEKLKEDENIEDILLLMAKCPSQDGYRLSERLAYEELQWSIGQLALSSSEIEKDNKPSPIQVRVKCSNGEFIIFHADVVAKIINPATGHLRHLVEEKKASEAYLHRNVAFIEHTVIWQGKPVKVSLHFKEHPDFPIMAYAADILNRRLCGHGSPPNDLALFEVTWNKKTIVYPVLISLTVPGINLRKVIDSLKYEFEEKLLSEFFICELIKHSGDGFARNYVLYFINHNKQVVPCNIDNEQMFVKTVTQEGRFLKENKVNEVNVIYCLPDFQEGGKLNKSLSKKALHTFATLEVNQLLNNWLDSVKEKEEAYCLLLDSTYQQQLQAIRGPSHPFMLNMVFPEGVVGKLAMELRLIKHLAGEAIKHNRDLSAKTLLEHCSGVKVANLYFSAGKLIPSKRLELVTNKKFTASSSEYQKYYLGRSKTYQELAVGHYTIDSARKEINQYYHELLTFEDNATAASYVNIPEGMVTVLDFQETSEARQKEQLERLKESNSFQQLYIKNCTVLTDLLLKELLQTSYTTLQVLSIHGHSQLTNDILGYLADNFVNLQILIASGIGMQSIQRTLGRYLEFKKLEVLLINHCQSLQRIYLSAPSLVYLEAKDNAKLTEVDLNLPQLKYASVEDSNNIINLLIDSNINCHLNLEELPEKCTTRLPKDWAKVHYKCCFNPAEYLKQGKNISLFKAIEEGRAGMVSWHIKQGALLTQRNKAGELALHYAASQGHLDITKILVEKMKILSLSIDTKDNNGKTPLVHAVWQGHFLVIDYLMQNGANSKIPLQRAVEESNILAINILITKGVHLSNYLSEDGIETFVTKLMDNNEHEKLQQLYTCKLNAKSAPENFFVNDYQGRYNTCLNINLPLGKHKLTALYIAVQNNYIEVIKTLISLGANPNQRVSNYWSQATPLVAAIQKGHIEVIKILLQNGASINRKCSVSYSTNNATPLYFAVLKGSLEIIKLLLTNGAISDVNTSDQYDITPLFVAARGGNEEIVEELLKSGANVNYIKQGSFFSPLHIAAYCGNSGVIKLLLINKATIDLSDRYGCTPLYLAAREGHNESIKILLTAGAAVNQANKENFTPLHAAVRAGHLETINILLNNGAKLSLDNNFYQSSDVLNVLMLAARYGKTAIFKRIVEQGIYPNCKIKDGFTPLNFATFYNQKQTEKYLLSIMPNTVESNKTCENLLYYVISYEHHKCLSLLTSKEYAEKLSLIDNEGNTILHITAAFGNLATLKYLLTLDEILPLLYRKNQLGFTPLHLAAIRTDGSPILSLLLSKGVKIDEIDNHGNTPLHKASEYGQIECFQTLVEAGANVQIVNVENDTPASIASKMVNIKMHSYKLQNSISNILTKASVKFSGSKSNTNFFQSGKMENNDIFRTNFNLKKQSKSNVEGVAALSSNHGLYKTQPNRMEEEKKKYNLTLPGQAMEIIQQQSYEENEVNLAALASQRNIQSINNGNTVKHCRVIPSKPDGDCGFTAVRLYLQLMGYHELAKKISREKFIKIVVKLSLYNDFSIQAMIEQIIKVDKASDIEDWKNKFKSSSYWLQDTHFALLSRHYHLKFNFYYLPAEDNNPTFYPELSNEEINTSTSKEVITIHLVHITTKLREENAVLNHYEGILIEPTKEQEWEIDKMLEQINEEYNRLALTVSQKPAMAH